MQVQDAMAGEFHVLGCNCKLTILGSRDFRSYRGDVEKWILGYLDL